MPTALMVLLRSIGLICGGHRAIVLENLALRQQLAVLTRTVKRPQLRSTDRLFWILLAKAWQGWRSALIIVQPDTVVRWHRQWLRRHWTRLSHRRRPGRPTTSSAIRALVSTMTTANPLWGAPRIHGELAKLGITVSERTVSRLLRRPRRPPSQTWRTFLTNHVATLVSMDFFTVPTLTGRVLFVLVLLTHQRRRIIHVNVTDHPTAVWTAQQMIEAFPEDTAPRWLLRDRDAIYGDVFRRRVVSMGIGEVVSGDRCEIHGAAASASLANVAHIFAESHRPDCGRFLRSSDRDLSPLVRAMLLAHGRRRIRHTAVIAHPTAAWTAQQLREAFPWDHAPRYVIHDRDHAFDGLEATATAMGIEDVRTAPQAPWQNAFFERFIGSARRECFDHVIVFNEAGLQRLMNRYCSSTGLARTPVAG